MNRIFARGRHSFVKGMDKILLDCDTGADDAVALMMLLKAKDIATPVGVTCVQGNTSLDNVVMNNLRLLKLFNMIGKIPLYRGCCGPLISNPLSIDATAVHGHDGMGNQPNFKPAASNDLLAHVEEEHAVNAIINLSKKYSGQLKLIAIGPLTNLAMAVKLDPELPSRLKALYIMGGTRHNKGNITPAAEFNFHFDPEAAYITLHSFGQLCEVHVIDWDYCISSPLHESFVNDWLSSTKSLSENALVNEHRQSFLKMVLADVRKFYENHFGKNKLSICDSYAMAVLLDPTLAPPPKSFLVNIETAGNFTRGAMIVDHYSKKTSKEYAGPVLLYDGIDMKKYKDMLYSIVLE